MAEPEELDEDLFADLYEAEDSTQGQTTAAVPHVPSEPEPPLIVAGNDEDDANLMLDVSNGQSSRSYDQEQHTVQHEANGGSTTGWQNTNGTSNVHNSHEGSGPPAHSGIGIKEDG